MSTKSGQPQFSRLTHEIETTGGAVQTATSALQLTPPEQANVYKNLEGPVYELYGARARTLLLLRLDALLSSGDVTYAYPTISVEHVLPQTPPTKSEWLQWFPEPATRLFWTHRLGNLALLNRSKNSAAFNFDFNTKKEAYFAKGGITPFVLTTQVLAEPVWTEEVVKKRQKKLLASFAGYWGIDAVAIGVSSVHA